MSTKVPRYLPASLLHATAADSFNGDDLKYGVNALHADFLIFLRFYPLLFPFPITPLSGSIPLAL